MGQRGSKKKREKDQEAAKHRPSYSHPDESQDP